MFLKLLHYFLFKIKLKFSQEINSYLVKLSINKNLMNKIYSLPKIFIQNRRVFDCTFFNDEIHLLLLRFEEYYDHVDKFVIIEIDKTHTGHLKIESNFLKHRNLFKKYENKILFEYIENSPNFVEQTAFTVEHFHREMINRILSKNAKENDIIFVSDSDEFWNIDTLKNIKNNSAAIYIYRHNLFYYYINCMQNQMIVGTICFPYGAISITESRSIINKINTIIFPYDKFQFMNFSHALEYTNLKIIIDGGNHYSWLNFNNKIYEKFNNIYEAPLIKNHNLPKESLLDKINSGSDILGRDEWQFKKIFIDKKSLTNPPKKLEWLLQQFPLLYKQPILQKIKNNVEIICPIFKSVKFLKMIYNELLRAKKNSNSDWDISIKILALDANLEILNYLKKNKIPHLIYKSFNPNQFYIKRVYKGYNFAAFNSKFDNLIFVNSDMIFSPNWLDNLIKHHDGINIPTSLLVESGHFNTRNYNYLKKLHDSNNNVDFNEFNKICNKISMDKIQNSGTYMPVIFEKNRFIESGGYPNGNVKNSSGKISNKKGKVYKSGDQYFFENILRDKFKMNHITIFDSISYHFQEGEKNE